MPNDIRPGDTYDQSSTAQFCPLYDYGDAPIRKYLDRGLNIGLDG